MLILLPICTLAGIWYCAYVTLEPRNGTTAFRLGFLVSLLLLALSSAGFCELLSFSSRLTPDALTSCWCVAASVSTIAGLRAYRSRRQWPVIPLLTRTETLLLGGTGLLLLLTLITGLVYPPNNYDSLTYHMGRVAHWLQNRNLSPYPTHIERELYQPPLAELLILTENLLTGADRLANMVQWLAEVGCLVALSLLTRQLGGNRLVQCITIFVAATIPMVLLQASSTQNDLVVSFFISTFLIFLVRLEKTRGLADLLFAGIALGEAWLTKGTAFLFTGTILLVCGIGWIGFYNKPSMRPSLGQFLSGGTLLLLMALLINGFQFSRNYTVYHHPLADPTTQSYYTNELHTPGAVASNVARNMALHFGVPGIHYVVQHGVEHAHKLVGASASDPRITYLGTLFDLPMLSNNEDNASDFLHMLLLLTASCWLLLRRNRAYIPFRYLLYLVMVMALFFAAYLRWQPWHSRLHTTIFLLASPISALFLAKLGEPSRTTPWVYGLLFFSALCFALTNPTRPYITLPPLTARVSAYTTPRLNKYYVLNRPLLQTHDRVEQYLWGKQKLRIGLLFDENGMDYLWFLRLTPFGTVNHTNVKGYSRAYEKPTPFSYIISTIPKADTLVNHGRTYARVCDVDSVTAVFAPMDSVRLVTGKK